MNNGFFKIYRELWDKPIWKQSTPIQKTVLLTLLSMVNFAPAEWEWQGQKFSVQPGQTITSLQHIAERCGKGVNAGNVRGALDRFVKLGFLANESTKTGRLLTVVNWALTSTLMTNGAQLTAKTLQRQCKVTAKAMHLIRRIRKKRKIRKIIFIKTLLLLPFPNKPNPYFLLVQHKSVL